MAVEPYRVTEAILTTYSGRKHQIEVITDILSKPIRKVKDEMLDAFCRISKNSSDPFVKIEVKIKKI